ncbi:uncharacterized protein LOC118468637 [Anopheles albimanus]|uniref:uncharacterized protein LOC118468637 n=1 Tax=Anopheles albimanus TaxID=7167 RepID=UPI001640A6F4|nr:uncharacterized protein LOC118468637 [Anopheles albimanus]
MDDHCYESKAYMKDGFSARGGYYWNTGKLATITTTDNLLPSKGFEVNMNHHGRSYTDTGTPVTAMATTATTAAATTGTAGDRGSWSTGLKSQLGIGLFDGRPLGGYGGPATASSALTSTTTTATSSSHNTTNTTSTFGYGYEYGNDYDYYDNRSCRSGPAYPGATDRPVIGLPAPTNPPSTNGGVRTGRKLPNPTRNGKRQLPQPKGEGALGGVLLAGSHYGSTDLQRIQSPTVRKLPVPVQRNLRSTPPGSQLPVAGAGLIDNFNLDLSVKARKSISGPVIDDDGLKRLNSNLFGNSLNYFCDLSQNKENFIAASSFYLNDRDRAHHHHHHQRHHHHHHHHNDDDDDDDDANDYCYSDFFMTSSITLSSRKIKKLPKIQTIANHPRPSQSMSFIAADVNAAYRNFSMVAEAPYNDGTSTHHQQPHQQQQKHQQAAIGYYEPDEYAGDVGGDGYASYGSDGTGRQGYCNHNPIYSDQIDNNNGSTHVGAALLLNGERTYSNGTGNALKSSLSSLSTKKQLPVIQPPVNHGSESLGYPYKQQLYPTSGTGNQGGRDDGLSMQLHNGHREPYGGDGLGSDPLTNTKQQQQQQRPTLMNDRVTALKSRSRSSTPVSASSGSTSTKQQSPYDSYQGYDAMNLVSNAGSSPSATTTAAASTIITSSSSPKLLPAKPGGTGGKGTAAAAAAAATPQTSYLAGSPDKKGAIPPPLVRRSSPDSRTLDSMYGGYDDGGTDGYDHHHQQQQRSSSTSSSSKYQHQHPDLMDESEYDGGGALYDDEDEEDADADQYGGEDDHHHHHNHHQHHHSAQPPPASSSSSSSSSSKKLPKLGGHDAKKHLHFFDEREECFDEELEELEQANAAKQSASSGTGAGGNGGGGGGGGSGTGSSLAAGASASTAALLEHGYDVKADKLDVLTGGGGVGVATANASTIPVTIGTTIIGGGGGGGGGSNGTSGPDGPLGTIVTDISKDITQQSQPSLQLQQGKRDNFNARDKWLWAYDQIINVSSTHN